MLIPLGASCGALALALTVAMRPPPSASPAASGNTRPRFDEKPKVRPAPGLVASLFAIEPLVEDPVAIAFDERGRLYIAESERQERGIEDNRSSAFWLNDDLQSQTVDDRLRMFAKWAAKREGGMAYYSRFEDRVRRIEDSDGDGRADCGTVFAAPFNEPLTGTGAGILASDGDVWYTNIPDLWRLRDEDGDGIADERTRMWTGFGVRVALRGHDMHGLTWGPDGKLYWSIGDRGYHIDLPDGRSLADPQSGAVFRCNPDGSELEVFCTGLRNPQELAFDDFGNLFTGDNNSDAGDKARIVYCVEAGETGWSMNYQTLEGTNVRGPWNQEEIWALRPELAPDRASAVSPVQPAWTIPPLAHVSSGPSGLAYDPGVGLPERYRQHFFLCDFLGGAEYSRVLSFRLEPVGAGFRVVDVEPFLENVLPTDIEFGYDGKVYVSDWGGGWYSNGLGEIYAVWDPTAIRDPRVAEVSTLFREGFRQRDSDELKDLLAHADRRVRQRAQFALAERGRASIPRFVDVARDGTDLHARVHAIWGLGMVARALPETERDAAMVPLVELLASPDPEVEVRAQAAKVLGEARYRDAVQPLVRLLTDDSARVRYFAALALGKMRAESAHDAIVAMLAENDGSDVFLRHAGVVALAWIGDRTATRRLMSEPQAELRLDAALVLRRWRDPAIARLLQDSDDRVVAEAARAINDLPIPEGMPALCALATRYISAPEPGSEESAGRFVRELWRNTNDAEVASLGTSSVFERTPDESTRTSIFAGQTNSGDHYAERISGLVEAPMTGAYVFQVSSDDHSTLRLSPNEDPELAGRIAWVEGYAGLGDWDGQPNQTSAPIMLEKGKRYYLEVRHAEGGGDDHVGVGWIRPDGAVERPIGAETGSALRLPILRRVINACVRSSDSAAPTTLALLAESPDVPEPMRLEAMSALGEWLQPAPRDRVIGAWRPATISDRDAAQYTTTLKQKLPGLAMRGSSAVRAAARELAASHAVALDGGANYEVVADTSASPSERAACLRQLCLDRDSRADDAISIGLASDQMPLRAEAREQLARRDPARGAEELRKGACAADPRERQASIRALGRVEGAAADEVLAELVGELETSKLPLSLQLDALLAARTRDGSPIAERADAWLSSLEAGSPQGRFRLGLEGGDPDRGRAIVHHHSSATCLKCHTVEGVGGDAAPKLDGVGSRLSRAEILESLVEPSRVIAQGFGTASAMPPMGEVLTLEEIRDVVEYLSTLKDSAAAPRASTSDASRARDAG